MRTRGKQLDSPLILIVHENKMTDEEPLLCLSGNSQLEMVADMSVSKPLDIQNGSQALISCRPGVLGAEMASSCTTRGLPGGVRPGSTGTPVADQEDLFNCMDLLRHVPGH